MPNANTIIFTAIIAAALAFLYLRVFGNSNTTGSSSSSTKIVSDSRSISEVIKLSEIMTVVIYASQTGTSEDYATKFAREYEKKFRLKTLAVSAEDYDLDDLNEIPEEILVFFFVSSAGEGELPDAALDFGEYLSSMNDNDSDSLNNLQYTVFGLGNSTYEFYNGAAVFVDKSLSKAGAIKFAPCGDGDDGKDSLEEDYIAWKEKTFAILTEKLNLTEYTDTYQPSVKITISEVEQESNSKTYLGELNAAFLPDNNNESNDKLTLGPFDHTLPFLAPIKSCKDLYNGKNGRHCIHVEFDLSSSNLKYSTGDHLGIFAYNSNLEVENFLNVFNLSSIKDKLVKIQNLTDIPTSVPSPTTFESIVRYYLEISGPVSRQLLGSLAEFAPLQETKTKLQEIAKDKEKFQEVVSSKKLSIADVLFTLSNGEKWEKVPHSFIIDSFAKLQPRFYSISSSASMEKQEVHVTAVVEAETCPTKLMNGKSYVTGVTTNLLHNINNFKNKASDKLYASYNLEGPRKLFENGDKLPIFVRRSTFRLPSNPALPVILIGAGTGVAPLRAFVRERVAMAKNGIKVGKIMLFFGCRNKDEFLFDEEWKDYGKALTDYDAELQVIVAFSREKDLKKTYVQDKMKENSTEIVKLLDSKGYIYVCGSASTLAKSVRSALIDILGKEKHKDEKSCSEILKKYKTQNRFQEDIW